jgi:hypothetical protein
MRRFAPPLHARFFIESPFAADPECSTNAASACGIEEAPVP